MADSKLETSIKAAIANAADHVAKADTVDEASQWQVIQNQQQAQLDALNE